MIASTENLDHTSVAQTKTDNHRLDCLTGMQIDKQTHTNKNKNT